VERAVKRAALLPFVGVQKPVVESPPFCRNVSPIWPQSRATIYDEDLGRHFCSGADHHRIRDLFGCRVDDR
jgi:hypothetical protein